MKSVTYEGREVDTTTEWYRLGEEIVNRWLRGEIENGPQWGLAPLRAILKTTNTAKQYLEVKAGYSSRLHIVANDLERYLP